MTITLTTTMAVLDSCPKHNMVAYLEKSEGNAKFHEIIDFLTRSSIHHALTVSPVVSTTFVEQFWTSAKLQSVSLKQRLARKSSSKKQRVHKESVSKQGRKFAKGEPLVQRDPLFDEIPKDTVDHMETKNAQDVGRTREIVDEDKEIDENILSTEDVLSTDKEKVSTDRPIVSTDGSKVSTDRQIKGTDEQIESTDEQRKGTEDHTEEESATQATQTHTSTIFGDDETIAKVLLNMSQAKAVSREKEKGVELKDIEETDIPRPTSTRSLLTLKPLLKIDPKDKGKKKIEEEDESKSESNGIPEAEKKRSPRRRQKKKLRRENKGEDKYQKEKTCTKVDKGENLEEINQNVVIRSNGQKRYFSTLMRVLSIFDRDDLNAIYQLVMDKYRDEIPGGFDKVLWEDLMVMFNPDDEDKF
ncbi:hypothetical protein Tco_0633678 [Tanacetum coccineum]